MVSVDGSCNYSVGILNKELSELSIFPNPTTGKMTISYPNGAEPIDLIIEDMNGRVIDKFSTISNVNGKIEVDLSSYETGIYLLQLRSTKWTESGRIIKQ